MMRPESLALIEQLKRCRATAQWAEGLIAEDAELHQENHAVQYGVDAFQAALQAALPPDFNLVYSQDTPSRFMVLLVGRPRFRTM